MKLYTMPGACSLADHIVLRWVGDPLTVQVVSRTEIKQPDFLALNPAGSVPVLEDDGFVLSQNVAILTYILDKYPDAGLVGDGSAQSRAEVYQWLVFINADVHGSFPPLFGAMAYLDESSQQQVKAHTRQKLRGYFECLNAQLEGKQWLMGTRSVADPYLFVVLQWAKNTGVDVSGLANLAAFDAQMAADAQVQQALDVEGIQHKPL